MSQHHNNEVVLFERGYEEVDYDLLNTLSIKYFNKKVCKTCRLERLNAYYKLKRKIMGISKNKYSFKRRTKTVQIGKHTINTNNIDSKNLKLLVQKYGEEWAEKNVDGFESKSKRTKDPSRETDKKIEKEEVKEKSK